MRSNAGMACRPVRFTRWHIRESGAEWTGSTDRSSYPRTVYGVQLVDLAGHVGANRFRRACDHAMGTAAGTGSRLDVPQWPTDCVDVPHELAKVVEGDLPLAFRLYRAMPCYANLM